MALLLGRTEQRKHSKTRAQQDCALSQLPLTATAAKQLVTDAASEDHLSFPASPTPASSPHHVDQVQNSIHGG